MFRRSSKTRLSRPIWMDKCSRTGCNMIGGSLGRGGISCRASMGETGAGGEGSSTWRYHGIDVSGGWLDGVCSSDCRKGVRRVKLLDCWFGRIDGRGHGFGIETAATDANASRTEWRHAAHRIRDRFILVVRVSLILAANPQECVKYHRLRCHKKRCMPKGRRCAKDLKMLASGAPCRLLQHQSCSRIAGSLGMRNAAAATRWPQLLKNRQKYIKPSKPHLKKYFFPTQRPSMQKQSTVDGFQVKILSIASTNYIRNLLL